MGVISERNTGSPSASTSAAAKVAQATRALRDKHGKLSSRCLRGARCEEFNVEGRETRCYFSWVTTTSLTQVQRVDSIAGKRAFSGDGTKKGDPLVLRGK